jgi:hypothetical protein
VLSFAALGGDDVRGFPREGSREGDGRGGEGGNGWLSGELEGREASTSSSELESSEAVEVSSSDEDCSEDCSGCASVMGASVGSISGFSAPGVFGVETGTSSWSDESSVVDTVANWLDGVTGEVSGPNGVFEERSPENLVTFEGIRLFL